MKKIPSTITPFSYTVFEDANWKLRLFSDGSLDVKQKTAGCSEHGDYEHVYDFLQEHHESLRTAGIEDAVHRLAEHINYPMCMFGDWISEAAARRAA